MEKSDPVIDPVIEAPTPEGRDRSHSEGNQTSPVKRFDGWCLDPFAEIRPHSVKTPFYDVFNDYPLPIEYDDRGKVKGIFNCFNCGSAEHRVNECEVVKDRSCIHLNKTWMQSYGKAPTAGSYRVPRTRTRYFEKLKELDEADDKDKGEELKQSGLKFFDSLEEMPVVPKLPSKRAKSISQMEKEEQEFRARRGGRRHYGNRGGYDNRNHHGGDRWRGNRGGYRPHNNNNHHRRNQPYDNRRRSSYGNQGYNGHRNGGHHNNQNNHHRRRGGYNNQRGRGGYHQRQQQQVFAPEPLHPQEYKHNWADYQY